MNTSLKLVSHTHTDPNSSDPSLLGAPADTILASARALAQQQHLPFAGSISPLAAWELVQQGSAILVDVRTHEERKFVGYVPASLHVAWMTGIELHRNPRFVSEFATKVRAKQALVVLLCRSGKRSAAAAEALTKAGYRNVLNVLEGFEGELDSNQQRGTSGGWRHHTLPWVQD